MVEYSTCLLTTFLLLVSLPVLARSDGDDLGLLRGGSHSLRVSQEEASSGPYTRAAESILFDHCQQVLVREWPGPSPSLSEVERICLDISTGSITKLQAHQPLIPSPRRLTDDSYANFRKDSDWEALIYAIVCVAGAAMAAGLTIGLMSIDPLELEIKQRVGTEEERSQAKRVMPLIVKHHRLLVTLLLYNAAANETLPIFLDKLVPSAIAVIISVTAVLIFGEIIPSALFSGPNQLRITSNLSGFVWVLMMLLAPIAWPIAWCLDYLFGDHNPRKRYNRAELSALIEIHQETKRRHQSMTSNVRERYPSSGGALVERQTSYNGAMKPDSMLSQDEVDIVVGVLKISSKTVQDCLVPITQVFMLSTDDVLDEEMLALIMSSGYSRIPVYQGHDPRHMRGYLLVKRLIVIEPRARRTVGSLSLRQPIVVSPKCPLIDLLNVFQEGKSHLAIVSKEPQKAIRCITSGQAIEGGAEPLGIITLEDVIEEILQEEILDEHDRTREFLERRRKGTQQILSASLLLRARPPGPDEGAGMDPALATRHRNPIDQLAVDLQVNSLNHSLDLEAAGLTPGSNHHNQVPGLARVTSAPNPPTDAPLPVTTPPLASSSALLTPDVAFPPSLLSPSFQHMVRRQRSVDHRLRTAGLTHAIPPTDNSSSMKGRKKGSLTRTHSEEITLDYNTPCRRSSSSEAASAASVEFPLSSQSDDSSPGGGHGHTNSVSAFFPFHPNSPSRLNGSSPISSPHRRGPSRQSSSLHPRQDSKEGGDDDANGTTGASTVFVDLGTETGAHEHHKGSGSGDSTRTRDSYEQNGGRQRTFGGEEEDEGEDTLSTPLLRSNPWF